MALSVNATTTTTTTRITAVESVRQPAVFPVIWHFLNHMSLSRRAIIITVEERTKARLFRRILKRCPLAVAGKQC
jgi:hypothetical protein